MDLSDRWPLPDSPDLGAELAASYADPSRGYHDTRHLTEVLDRLDELARAGTDYEPTAVLLAAWFHDAVYDPRADDNEERSAALAEQALPDLGLTPERVAEVARLVRLTDGHDVDPGDRDGGLLADADLAILASSHRDYDAYTRAVREEYAHVPDEVFRIGRATILQKLIALPALYHIVPKRTEWTAKAHGNLRRELAVLLDV